MGGLAGGFGGDLGASFEALLGGGDLGDLGGSVPDIVKPASSPSLHVGFSNPPADAAPAQPDDE